MLLGRSGISAAAAASTTIAAVTTAAAVAVATAVAAMMASMAAAMAATVASAVAAVAAIAATTAMTEGHRLVVTAQEGDTDDREENRETKNNNTVHSQILQKYLQVPVSQNYQVAVRDDRIATTDGSVSQCDPSFMIHYIQRLPEQFPVVNF